MMSKFTVLRILIVFICVTVHVGFTFAQEEFLVGYWPFEDDLTDHGPNGYDGTGVGTFEFVEGIVGQGISFGDTGCVVVGTFNPAEQGEMTATMWVNWAGPNAGGTWQHFFVKRNDGWIQEELYINFGIHQNDSRIYLNGIESGTWWTYFGDNTIPLSTEEWHHIAIVMTTDYATLYIDGETFEAWEMQESFSFGVNDSSTVAIGAERTGRWPFNGIVDEVRMYSIELDESEIIAIMDDEGVAVDEHVNSEIPDNFQLHQNYPNPFNPSTTITYTATITAEVALKIYNTAGQEVTTLVQQTMQAGTHTVQWDGLDHQGDKVPAGVYYYQLKSAESVQTKKMLLIY